MGKTILLVDDEEGIRKVLSIALADAGYEVLTAENGVDALEIFKKVHPPIVLTDIKMPEMDGIELLRKIKQSSANTEVIIITGHGDLDLAIKSVKFEATDFVTKPINDDTLDIALKRAEERIEMRAQLSEYTQNLEDLVEEKTRKLLEAERLAAVGKTVAGLSHAIKNIAGGLKGGAFVLEKGIEVDNREYLLDGWEMIRKNVDKITRLSLDLLNYAKDTRLNFQRCHPNAPVQEVADLMARRAQEHGIELLLDLEPDLEPIFFDPDLMHRCLLNLVTNAIDACICDRSAKQKKQVVLRSCSASGWGVEYQVVDNGCGMTPAVSKSIFHSFFTTKGTDGTGIGLMITKKIVDEHQGVIEVETAEGSGSKFSVKLPGKK
jgi:signal transduction histidine kinase